MQPLFEAFCGEDHAQAPLAALLADLSVTYCCLVMLHDYMAAFTASQVAQLPNTEWLGVRCLAVSHNVRWVDPFHREMMPSSSSCGMTASSSSCLSVVSP